MEIRRALNPEEQCQCTNTPVGQCINAKLPNSDYCPVHGGNQGEAAATKAELDNFRLTKFKARTQRFHDSKNIKSVKDEISIMRMMLEERLEQCDDARDLIYQSAAVADLLMKINTLVTSCHKIEKSMGVLLDKSAIVQFAQEMLTLISAHVTDEMALENISNGILRLIGEIGIGEADDT